MNRKHIRISLIIPAYNEERHLAACLTSIQNQTIPFDEVIVVNNRSTDNTVAIADSFPFVRLIDEPQRGRVYARNTGFNAASGDILARIDADAVLPNNWTESVIRHFDRADNIHTAWTGGALFYNIRFPRFVSWLYNFLVFGVNRLLAGHPTLWGSNMAVPKQVWEQVSKDICLRNDIHEDLDLAIHVHRHGIQIIYDTSVRMNVQLRRVRSNRHELWKYLQMWPTTLRIHRISSWPICWFFGCFLLYLVTPLFGVAERLARFIGKRPLND